MIRTAVRLSTLAALTNGGNSPFPTLAGAAVFDSRQDEISDLAPNQCVPVLIVRTDDDRREHVDARDKSRSLTLRIEAAVMTTAKDADGNPRSPWPETDSTLEAMLDLLEWQVHVALRGYSKWTLWWKSLWGFTASTSLPLYTPPNKGRVRLAVRELTIPLQSGKFCEVIPKPLHDDDVEHDTDGDPIVPEPALPELLVNVFDKIAAEGGGDLKIAAAELRAVLEGQQLPGTSVYPALRSVRLYVPETDPPPGEEPEIDIEAEMVGDLPER